MEKAVQISQIIANGAQVILLLGLYFAWTQIKIAIKDIRLRSQRDAGTVAISQAEAFAKKIIPSYGGFASHLENSLSLSLPQYRPDEIFSKYLPRYTEDLKKLDDVNFINKVMDCANDLECIALSFTKGMADEEIVFNALAKTYCEIVEDLYFFYCSQRSEKNVKHYQSTIDLYGTWKQRLKKVNLEEERKTLEGRTNAITKEIESTIEKSAPIIALGKDFK